MIELHLRGRVASGRRPDLESFLEETIPFYESSGGIRVRMLWDVADPERFVEVIEYADRAAHDRDELRVENGVQMRDVLERWRDLLDGAPVVETYLGQ